jgi:hypothetical protein
LPKSDLNFERSADDLPRVPSEPSAERQRSHPVEDLRRHAGNRAVQQLFANSKRSSERPLAADVPTEAAAVTRRPGIPLDPDIRRQAEAQYSSDFSEVRAHTDERAARSAASVHAHAYTLANDIVFAAGKYSPSTHGGQQLIAHELAHVAQHRRQSAPLSLERSADDVDVQTSKVPTDVTEQGSLRSTVNHAVRTTFGLSGLGVNASNISFVDQAEFAKRFPASELPEKLFSLFLDFGYFRGTAFYFILEYNQQPYHLTGPSTFTDSVERLRHFVNDAIKKGYFDFQSRELDVTTGKPFPVEHINPAELAARYLAGITTTAGPRDKRKILMQVGTDVEDLVHEVCHFYVHDAFTQFAASHKDAHEYLWDARIGQILKEGFTEHFGREVMKAHSKELGPLRGQGYPNEVEGAGLLIYTLGEDNARKAFFAGDAKQIAVLGRIIDAYKKEPDLMIPTGYVQ